MPRLKRVISVVLVSVGAIGLMAAGTVYGVSSSVLGKRYDAPLRDVPVSSDSITIARGAHLSSAVGKCVDCHNADFGGKVFFDSPVLGRITASNLTMGRGGVLASYTDASLARAIRHGIKHDGRAALFMPSDDWITLADEDVGAIISYIRSLPSVDRVLEPTMLRPVGRTLLAAGQLPVISAARLDHSLRAVVSMPVDSSLAYGKYMADVGGCTNCHGPGLSGGRLPGAPPELKPAANITPEGIGHLSDAQLESVLRSGRRPDGSELDSLMPWRYTALLTPVEMRALIKYLRTVDAKPFGGR